MSPNQERCAGRELRRPCRSWLTRTDPTRPLLLWDLTDLNNLRDDPLGRACALTGGGLTPDEWDRHIPDLDYVDPCAT